MRVAVVGGTGVVGRVTARQLVEQGAKVRVLSRTPPASPIAGTEHAVVDVRTGEGLRAGLEDVQVVVDATNSTRHAAAVLVEGTGHLSQAAKAAGVEHHVLVSIVGCDEVPTSYYAAKVAQEQAVMDGSVPWSILRATQFHDLIAGFLSTIAKAGVRPRSSAELQPVDPTTVAELLAEAAVLGPRGRLADVGGPRVETISALADQWSQATRRGRVPVPLPLPGKAGRAIRAGALCTRHQTTDGPTFSARVTQDTVGMGRRT